MADQLLTPVQIEAAAKPLAILKEASTMAGEVMSIAGSAQRASAGYLAAVEALAATDPAWVDVMLKRLTEAIAAAKAACAFTDEQKTLIGRIVTELLS